MNAFRKVQTCRILNNLKCIVSRTVTEVICILMRKIDQSGCSIYIIWPCEPIRLRYVNYNQYGDADRTTKAFCSQCQRAAVVAHTETKAPDKGEKWHHLSAKLSVVDVAKVNITNKNKNSTKFTLFFFKI